VTKVVLPPVTPEEDQPWNQHWVKKIKLNADMKIFLPSWVKHTKELEKAKDTYFERIGITCLKQHILERIGNKNVKGFKLIQDLFKKSIALFAENGILDELHADPDKTSIHTIFTDNDSNINFQEAHTDYDYLTRQIDSETPPRYSWTAHMPITTEGSSITLWFGTGAGYTMHIPHGTVLLLQSDVIHGGGAPKVEEHMEKKTFHRLHLYLVMNDQPAYPGTINLWAYNNKTLLCDMHVQPPRNFFTAKKKQLYM
jgi:hypothetical protein